MSSNCTAKVSSVSNCVDGLTSAYVSYGTVSACSADTFIRKSELDEAMSNAMKKSQPDVSPDIKSTISHDGKNISITTYDNGFKQKTKTLLPDLKDIIAYNNRVVIVKFADGTQEKAVLHPDDPFTVEQGVSICITKKLMGGSSIYNKVMEYAVDVINKKAKAAQKKAEDEAARKERAKTMARNKQERKARKREEYIQTQAEIMARAMIEAKKMEEHNL